MNFFFSVLLKWLNLCWSPASHRLMFRPTDVKDMGHIGLHLHLKETILYLSLLFIKLLFRAPYLSSLLPAILTSPLNTHTLLKCSVSDRFRQSGSQQKRNVNDFLVH